MNKTKVAFIIYDYDDTFEKLTAFLKLKPTDTEEKTSGTAGRWELASSISESEEIEKHLQGLLKILMPSSEQIKELAKRYRCVISVGVHYYEFNPEIVLTPKTLSDLASLGVKLWIDLYNMWDGETDHDDHKPSKL